MGTLLFLLFGLTVIVSIIFLLYKHQSNLIKIQISELSLTNAEMIPVQCTISSKSLAIDYEPFTISGEMYIRDNFFYITPKQHFTLSFLLQHNLPILFTRDLDGIKKLTKLNNIVIPDAISYINSNSIDIKYHVHSIGKMDRGIIVELLDVNKKEEFQKIKKWSYQR